MKTTLRRSTAKLAFAFWLALTALNGGCADRESASATPRSAQTAQNGDSGDSAQSGQNERTAQNGENGQAAPTESNAASALGDATERFAQIFAESAADGSDDVGENGADGSAWDASLVDDETKRKYSADRTSVEPILAPREDENGAESDASRPKFKLEYRFEPDSRLAWNVVHQVRKKISYGGQARLIQTSSTTFRRWDFGPESPENAGKFAARHTIDRMILRQNEEGKEPIDYDSERDLAVPKEIAAFGTEKAVGVVLETFKIDRFGVMSEKKKLVDEYQGREGDSNVLVPFPKEPVGVGDVWTIPYAIYLKGADGNVRPYRVVERFRLENVDEKRATISFKTILLSIVDDPVVEGALAERLFSGRALFDRERGLTLRTELTFEKTVANAFGESSFLEYHCQVVEKLVRDDETPETPEN